MLRIKTSIHTPEHWFSKWDCRTHHTWLLWLPWHQSLLSPKAVSTKHHHGQGMHYFSIKTSIASTLLIEDGSCVRLVLHRHKNDACDYVKSIHFLKIFYAKRIWWISKNKSKKTVYHMKIKMRQTHLCMHFIFVSPNIISSPTWILYRIRMHCNYRTLTLLSRSKALPSCSEAKIITATIEEKHHTRITRHSNTNSRNKITSEAKHIC